MLDFFFFFIQISHLTTVERGIFEGISNLETAAIMIVASLRMNLKLICEFVNSCWHVLILFWLV